VRYRSDHKAATRRRIVDAASQAFRERGVAETGVDEVMRKAGLTHGGFYAHFRDKSELIAEACESAFAAAVENLERIAGLPTAAKRARLLIDSYLSTHHRDHRGTGCLVVSVGADISRYSGAVLSRYSHGFTSHLNRLCAALRLSADAVENEDRVTHLMSALVGALIFARAVDDPKRSDALLVSSRRMLRREFCSSP